MKSIILNENSKKIIFIHGWGGNENSLYNLASLFKHKYECHLLCLSGFDEELKKEYDVNDYVEEISNYILVNKIDNPIIIGHSFGGKLAFFLKLKNPNLIIIGIAPSIRKNPFSFKIFFKIKLYKLLKLFHFKIPNCLKGSKDYQNSKGYLKKTFLNVHHKYLTNYELNKIENALIIGFKNDKEVNYKVLKKISNQKIKFILLEGNHFGFNESLLNVYHIIMCYLNNLL